MSVYPPTPTMSVMHGGADRKRAKRPPSVGSKELNSQENQMLFSLVGPEAVSLVAAVVQLLKSDRGSWRVELPHGVISLVKDYAQRAYFLRIFDILEERVLWDFKLYKAFRAQSFPQCRKLLAFEQTENGDDGVVLGLNFFSEYESAEFKEHLDRRHAQERKSNNVVRPGMPMVMTTGISATPTRPFEITQAYGGTIRGPPMTIGGGQGITPMGTMSALTQTQSDGNSASSGSSWFKKDKNKKKDKKFKIKKEDISNPTNFQHKAHVGWNQDSGFSNTVYDDDMDEATRNILKAAGLESNNLNEDDKKFVKKFIAKNYDKYVSVGNLDPSQISAPMAPPIQQQPTQQSWNQTPARPYKPSFPSSAPISSSSYTSSPVAPPPPTRVESHGLAPARPPPPPPTMNRGYAPSRPLPQAPSYAPSPDTRPHAVPPPPPPPPPASIPAPVSSSAPPPPPPPPPMPSGGLPPVVSGAPPPPPPPPPSGGPSAVLANLPPAQNGRSNLLAEIQAGKQLRSVQQSSTESPKTGDARGDVMAQIRQGAQLKHVDPAVEQERRKSTTAGAAGMGGLAGALAKALEERRLNMGIDDTSDDDEDDDEKNEWSD